MPTENVYVGSQANSLGHLVIIFVRGWRARPALWVIGILLSSRSVFACTALPFY